ncbi:MAG: M42 family metallopeptidase [Ruminococcaceae bacterium]|nr:M42 family metallopeptidase [Oscillospiraceae bacterium]
MIELLEKLCNLDATSGDEGAVRDFIISKIDGFCAWRVDNLGNIIAFKKGAKTPAKRVMLDAHMDEVGLIVTSITTEGFLKFSTVGGIDTAALMFRNVKINGKTNGVICGKPIHMLSADERKKLPKEDSLYIDIGAADREDALKFVNIGDRAVICGECSINDGMLLSKAIDDRAGCAILIDILKRDSEYDFYASFSVQEEVGLRGAKTAAFAIEPDCAIIIESTTAADIAGVSEEDKVCKLGQGPAVSFMDKATVYDREFYNAAINSGIPCQPKSAVAGGNNSGAVHLSREGVRTIAISLPCRYIHSSSSVANKEDFLNTGKLVRYMLSGICSGEIK